MILEPGGEFDFKKVLDKRGVESFGDDHAVVERVFLAIPEKAPAYLDGMAVVSFKNDAEDVGTAEKKLKDKVRIVDLISPFSGEAGEVNGAGDWGRPVAIRFQRDRLEGKQWGGLEKVDKKQDQNQHAGITV